jgi:hypothetical protein
MYEAEIKAVVEGDAEREEKLKAIEDDWKKEKREWLKTESEDDSKWRVDEEKTKGVIERSIDKSLLSKIKECETTYDMYKKLIEVSKKNENIQAYYTYAKYENIKYNSRIPISEYLKQYQDILERLESTKCKQTEYCASMKLLNTLPESYYVCVQTLIQNDEINLSIVREVLVRAEASMKIEKEVLKIDEEVYAQNTETKGERNICANEGCKMGIVFRAPQDAIYCSDCFIKERKEN